MKKEKNERYQGTIWLYPVIKKIQVKPEEMLYRNKIIQNMVILTAKI